MRISAHARRHRGSVVAEAEKTRTSSASDSRRGTDEEVSNVDDAEGDWTSQLAFTHVASPAYTWHHAAGISGNRHDRNNARQNLPSCPPAGTAGRESACVTLSWSHTISCPPGRTFPTAASTWSTSHPLWSPEILTGLLAVHGLRVPADLEVRAAHGAGLLSHGARDGEDFFHGLDVPAGGFVVVEDLVSGVALGGGGERDLVAARTCPRSEATLVPRLWRESFSARPSCGFGRAAEASTIAENKHATTRNERAMVSSAGGVRRLSVNVNSEISIYLTHHLPRARSARWPDWVWAVEVYFDLNEALSKFYVTKSTSSMQLY